VNKYDIASIVLLSVIIVLVTWLVINNGSNYSYSNSVNGLECVYNCSEFKTLVQSLK
jgi:hypothetical protein